MSRTKRKDRIDVEKPVSFISFGGSVVDTTPTKKEKRKAHSDKKKYYKPTKDFKKAEARKDDAKPKQRLKEAIAHGDDFDDVVLPDPKKHFEWDWN